MDSSVQVSVCVFSYNYGKYLAQALDSILAQETSFDFEIVLGDDFSTDNTRAIASEYSDRYPGKFILSFNETNIGGTRNWLRAMNKCRGKYIALLDGDDYFTDKAKLQKQYDALESDDDLVLCFHGVEEKYDDISGSDRVIVFEKELYTLSDLLGRGWFIRTATIFFRNGIAPAEPPEWVYDFPYRYDTILHVFLCMHGNAVFLKDVMSVWRKHSKGMSKAMNDQLIWNTETEVALARQLDKYTGFACTGQVKRYIARTYSDLFFRILTSADRFRHIPEMIKCIRFMDFGRSFYTIKRKLYGTPKTSLG